MTIELVKQIKKILKKESVTVESFYHERNGELRIKVFDEIVKSKYDGVTITPSTACERKKKTTEKMVSILNALSKNGLQPEYRTEERVNSNFHGIYDSRYIIFK
jgi:hypothetical protein